MRDFPADEAVPGYALDTMRVHDLPRVLEIERACFNDPWSRSAFLYEIRDNKVALNHVLRCMAQAGRVDAYSCLYFLEDELEINNIAVDEIGRAHV